MIPLLRSSLTGSFAAFITFSCQQFTILRFHLGRRRISFALASIRGDLRCYRAADPGSFPIGSDAEG